MTIKAIFGLGNPGDKYKYTYHNLGELFIDYLQEKHGGNAVEIKGTQVKLIKPSESNAYMNELGPYVKKTAKKMGLRPEEILVVQDDSDIMMGKFRHSFGRSSAGHRGIESVINALGTNKFHRIRIGIRKKPGKALDFVLKNFSAAEKKAFANIFEDIEKNLSRLP